MNPKGYAREQCDIVFTFSISKVDDKRGTYQMFDNIAWRKDPYSRDSIRNKPHDTIDREIRTPTLNIHLHRTSMNKWCEWAISKKFVVVVFDVVISSLLPLSSSKNNSTWYFDITLTYLERRTNDHLNWHAMLLNYAVRFFLCSSCVCMPFGWARYFHALQCARDSFASKDTLFGQSIVKFAHWPLGSRR